MDALREYQVSFDRTALLRSAPTRGAPAVKHPLFFSSWPVALNAVSGEATQSPEVSKEIKTARQALIARLPASYRIELGGSIEEGSNANDALATFFPAMTAAMLIVVMLQVWSFSTMRRRVLFRVECDRLAVALENRRASQ